MTRKAITWHPLDAVMVEGGLITDAICPSCGTSLAVIMLTPDHGLTTSFPTCASGHLSPP